MSDRDRQGAVEQAKRGCVVVVALLMVAAVASAALALTSILTQVLAALLILGGVGLALVVWAVQW